MECAENYQKLIARRAELLKKVDIHFRHGNDFKQQGADLETQYLMEMDSIDHVLDTNCIGRYKFAMEFAKKNRVNRVFDIGCAYGHQSEVFNASGIEYIGINEHDLSPFWNKDQFKYIVKHYPFSIEATNNDMAVSILCLVWNCYLHDGDRTLNEQLESLSRDFKKALLYIPQEKISHVAKYYDKFEVYENGMAYFAKEVE